MSQVPSSAFRVPRLAAEQSEVTIGVGMQWSRRHSLWRAWLASLLSVFTAAACVAAADLPLEIGRLEKVYETQLATIREATQLRIKELQADTLASLREVEKSVRERGQLELLLTVRTERSRFLCLRKVDEADLLNSLPEVREIQEQYRESIALLPLEEAGLVDTLANQFDRSIDGLQKGLTLSGAIDQAVAVKEYRATVLKRPEITAARSILADAEASQLEATAPVAPPARPPTPAVAGEPESETREGDEIRARIRTRYRRMCDHVRAQEWQEVLAHIDPELVRKRGTDMVMAHLRIAFAFLMFAEVQDIETGAGEITLNEGGETAGLVPRTYQHDEWRDAAPTIWRLENGEWYMRPAPELRQRRRHAGLRKPEKRKP